MTAQSESELAWDLVELSRDRLTNAERNMASVHLGAGDYLAAMQHIVGVLVQRQFRVGADLHQRMQAWADIYDVSPVIRHLLARALSALEAVQPSA